MRPTHVAPPQERNRQEWIPVAISYVYFHLAEKKLAGFEWGVLRKPEIYVIDEVKPFTPPTQNFSHYLNKIYVALTRTLQALIDLIFWLPRVAVQIIKFTKFNFYNNNELNVQLKAERTG